MGFVRLLLVISLGLFLPLGAEAHGALDERIKGLNAEIAVATNAAALYIQRGELHREHQDWNAAAADFDRAWQLDAKLLRVDFFRARLFNDLGEPAKARRCLDILLLVATNDAEALILRARTLAKLGEPAGAAADYSRAIGLMREPQPEFFLEQAELLVAAGQPDQALVGLDEGVKRLGPLVVLQMRALDLELSRTNYDGALQRLQTIVDAAPRKESWLARQGDILQQAGREAAARKAWTDAMAAINALPERLQQSQAMLELRLRVAGRLTEAANVPSVKPAPVR